MKALKRKNALQDLDPEIYHELKKEVWIQNSWIRNQDWKRSKKISKLNDYILISKDIAQNIGNYWASEGLETKIRIQNIVFPEGIVMDTKIRAYLTKKVNAIFEQSADLKGVSEGENENGTRKNLVPSCVVSGSRLEVANLPVYNIFISNCLCRIKMIGQLPTHTNLIYLPFT